MGRYTSGLCEAVTIVSREARIQCARNAPGGSLASSRGAGFMNAASGLFVRRSAHNALQRVGRPVDDFLSGLIAWPRREQESNHQAVDEKLHRGSCVPKHVPFPFVRARAGQRLDRAMPTFYTPSGATGSVASPLVATPAGGVTGCAGRVDGPIPGWLLFAVWPSFTPTRGAVACSSNPSALSRGPPPGTDELGAPAAAGAGSRSRPSVRRSSWPDCGVFHRAAAAPTAPPSTHPKIKAPR